jgi:hypothetical protein
MPKSQTAIANDITKTILSSISDCGGDYYTEDNLVLKVTEDGHIKVDQDDQDENALVFRITVELVK